MRISVLHQPVAIPRQRAYGTDSTTGRGLRLVATLAVAWAVDRDADGKAVWFEVRTVGDSGALIEPWEPAPTSLRCWSRSAISVATGRRRPLSRSSARLRAGWRAVA